MTIKEKLFILKDDEYKKFQSKLMPTVNSNIIIGVRVPVLRQLAKEIFKSGEYVGFLNALPHKYYDENNLHAFIIEQIPDFNTSLLETEKFLPYIDNWATCDMFMPRCFKNNLDEMLKEIKKWLKTKETYTIRYGVGVLMKLFLDDNFKLEYANLVAEIKSEEYYVNMMIAWYFATALSKQYDDILPFLTKKQLSVWVHNKTIQKAVESNRISGDIKMFLKTLKR